MNRLGFVSVAIGAILYLVWPEAGPVPQELPRPPVQVRAHIPSHTNCMYNQTGHLIYARAGGWCSPRSY